MAWVAVGAGVGTFAAGMLNKGGKGGGGGGGSQYVPNGLATADDRWQNANTSEYDIASGARTAAIPAYQQSFDRAMGIDYQPYLDYAGRSGQAFGQMGDAAMAQVGGYGQQAQRASDQQAAMYGAGARVMDTAFDPQGALYGRTAQQVQDQVRAGQAARGLGNSEAGMMEEAGAMGNFNIDWQNAQLARQATGIQAGAQASHAGVSQGQMYGADESAALAAGAAGAGYYGQAGQVPITAAEYAAGGPGRAATGLTTGYGTVAQGYGNVASQAVPYMNAGNGAIQQNWQNAYTTNRDMAAGLGQMGQAAGNWFGNGGAGAAQGAFAQTDLGSSGWGTGAAYGNQDYGMFL